MSRTPRRAYDPMLQGLWAGFSTINSRAQVINNRDGPGP